MVYYEIVFYIYLLQGCFFVLYCSTTPSYIHDRRVEPFIEMLSIVILVVLLWFPLLITVSVIIYKDRKKLTE